MNAIKLSETAYELRAGCSRPHKETTKLGGKGETSS